MHILFFKALAVVATFGIGRLGGIISEKIAESNKSDRLFSLGNALAGGIFLGTALVHMLPDAHEGFEEFVGYTEFPWISVLAACGFLLILFLQKILMYEQNAVLPRSGNKPARKFSPTVLMMALSVHSIIAGIALGAEDIFSRAVILFIPILAYKISAVFALEVNLHRAGIQSKLVKKASSIFCFVTPLGIIIGSILAVFLEGKLGNLFEATFDAMAAGTFLYIALIDIIEQEFIHLQDKWFKFILLAFGFSAMVVLAFFT